MKKTIELKVGGIYTEVLLDDGATPRDLYEEIMDAIVQNEHHPEFNEK